MKAKLILRIIILGWLIGKSIFFLPSLYAARPNNSTGAGLLKDGLADLQLLGTVIELDPWKSVAIIKHKGLKKKVYCQAGDEVVGYQVIKVIRGSVILMKDGRITSLDFPLGTIVAPFTELSDYARTVNRNTLVKKISDLNSTGMQVVSLPYIEAGKILGLQVVRIKDKELAEMSGLKEGDIALSLNGEKIDGMQKALELYHKFKNQNEIDLQIRRGRENITLRYFLID